jgi:hypothetical protein
LILVEGQPVTTFALTGSVDQKKKSVIYFLVFIRYYCPAVQKYLPGAAGFFRGEKGTRCKSVTLGQRCKRGQRLLYATASFHGREGAVGGGSASQKTCLGEKDFLVRNKSVSRCKPGHGLFFAQPAGISQMEKDRR